MNPPRKGGHEGVWATEGLVEGLKKHHAAGMSCTQIARTLGHGLTRNAVIGKIHRMGIGHERPAPPPRNRPTAESKAWAKPSAPRRAAEAFTDPQTRIIADKHNVTEPEPRPALYVVAGKNWEPLPGSQPRTILELPKVGLCRWPIGPDLLACCEKVVTGKPYCAPHHALTVKREAATPRRDDLSRLARLAR